MSNSTRDLISAISSGNSVDIENSFNLAMAEKVSARLDDMRVTLAKDMFKEKISEPEVAAESQTEE